MAHVMTSSVVITARVPGLASVSPAQRRETNRRSPKKAESSQIHVPGPLLANFLEDMNHCVSPDRSSERGGKFSTDPDP